MCENPICDTDLGRGSKCWRYCHWMLETALRVAMQRHHTWRTASVMIYKEKHVSIKHAVLVEIREKGLLVVAIVANGSP